MLGRKIDPELPMTSPLIEEIKLQNGDPVEGNRYLGIRNGQRNGNPPGLLAGPFRQHHLFGSDILAQVQAKGDRKDKIQNQSENRIGKENLGTEVDHP